MALMDRISTLASSVRIRVILFLAILTVTILAFLNSIATPVSADTTVSTVGQLRDAIEAANGGADSIIKVQDGTYVLDNALTIGVELTTEAAGTEIPVITSPELSPLFEFTGSAMATFARIGLIATRPIILESDTASATVNDVRLEILK